MRCSIIPPYLLDRVATATDPAHAKAAAAAQSSLALEVEKPFRAIRAAVQPTLLMARPLAGETAREIEDPERSIYATDNTTELPGTLVRSEGDPDVDDVAVNEAYNGLGDTHELFRAVYSRASIDDNNLPLDATVHYGDEYDNAFWDGERMVFGDGDDEVFIRMTASVTVIGHELTHGVTQYSTNLDYEGQSGALNESISDVFGVLVEQYALRQSVTDASWLIGAGLFTDAVQGEALRSLKAPGTAYDDDVLGKDPQPAHMDGYIDTTEDNGGVHLNSGIPNHAFYLFATELGGNAWERAGQVWYDTITDGGLASDADFTAFATATRDATIARFGEESGETTAITGAWDGVGVAVSA